MAPPSAEIAQMAKEVKPSDATDFAETKSKNLPEKKEKKQEEKNGSTIMSEAITKEAAEKQAMETLFQQVYLPAFMTKLASRGVVPSNANELNSLVQIATQLRAVGATPMSKSDRFAKHASALNTVITNAATPSPVKQALSNPAVLDAVSKLNA